MSQCTTGCTVQLVDIDGDGFADYAQVNQGGGTGSARLNLHTTNSDGTIAWGSDQLIVDESATLTGSGNTFKFAPLNGTGRGDFAMIVPSTGAVGEWTNMGPGPDSGDLWNFSVYNVLAYGSTSFDGATTYVDFADINGDGAADYLNVEPATGAVFAWINQVTTGEWVYWGEIATGQSQTGDRVIFADINGDHLADYLIVHSDNSVDAWLNNSAGAH